MDPKLSDFRTITIGDFNNDGTKEILALALLTNIANMCGVMTAEDQL